MQTSQTVRPSTEDMFSANPGICATTVGSDDSQYTSRGDGYGSIPTVLYGPGGANVHSAGEYVLAEDVIGVAKILAVVLLRWCGVA